MAETLQHAQKLETSMCGRQDAADDSFSLGQKMLEMSRSAYQEEDITWIVHHTRRVEAPRKY